MTALWHSRQLDNFQYLAVLNSLSGRSVEDLSQYPIMPWTYTDFTSANVDLSDSSRYRDLRLPIGAINADCLQSLRRRLEEVTIMNEATATSASELLSPLESAMECNDVNAVLQLASDVRERQRNS